MRTYSFFTLFHKAFYGFLLRTVNKLLSFLTTRLRSFVCATLNIYNWQSIILHVTGKRKAQILFSNKQFVNEIFILSYYIGGEYNNVCTQ